MYQRTKPKVGERTRVPSQPPPGRPAQTSLTRTESGRAAGWKAKAYDGEDVGLDLEGVYIISVAARILEMHPQTLRKYERLGLIRPGRTLGMLRLYSREDIQKVRLIRHLGNMGLNLAGVEFALATVENLVRLRRRLLASAEEDRVQGSIDQEIRNVFRNLNLPVAD